MCVSMCVEHEPLSLCARSALVSHGMFRCVTARARASACERERAYVTAYNNVYGNVCEVPAPVIV